MAVEAPGPDDLLQQAAAEMTAAPAARREGLLQWRSLSLLATLETNHYAAAAAAVAAAVAAAAAAAAGPSRQATTVI